MSKIIRIAYLPLTKANWSNPELEKHGFKKGDAYINFMTGDADLDTNYLETDDEGNVTKEGIIEDGETDSNDR